MWWLWIPLLGGGIFLPLVIALVAFHRQRRFMDLVRQQSCPICKNPFDDAIAEYLGGVREADLERLDRFQRQYAHCRIRCGDCNAELICADNGVPMKAIAEESGG